MDAEDDRVSFLFSVAFRASLRRRELLIPGLLALLPAMATRIGAQDRRLAAASSTAVCLGSALLVGWVVAQMIGIRSIGEARCPLSASPGFSGDARDPLALGALAAGTAVAAVACSTFWLPIHVAIRPERPTWFASMLIVGVAVGAAGACALVVGVLDSLLPKAAALAASGAWLLFSCTLAPSSVGITGRIGATLAFPVSPALLASDEAAHLGNVLRALGSIACFDLGLFALLIAVEMRRPP